MISGRSHSPLETSVQYIKGIGPRRAGALKKLGIHTVRDLLHYFPRDYLDLSRVETISGLRRLVNSDQYVTVVGTVRTFDVVGRPPRQRFVVILGDNSGTVQLVFFQSIRFFKKSFHVGETIAVSGKVGAFQNRPQFVHPSIDRIAPPADDKSEEDHEERRQDLLHTGGIVPKYSSSEELQKVNLETKGFRRIIKAALDQFSDAVEEFLPDDIVQRNGILQRREAVKQIHFPDDHDRLHEAQRRLKFDEFFALEILLALRRKIVKVESRGIAFSVESKLARMLVDSLPFKFTKAQVRVINEIAEDMKSSRPMNRLLQGDVGSGKTVVALTAMLIAINNGYQAALMAPTEILAEQHFRTLARLAGALPVNVRLLIGGQREKLRKDILDDVRRGSANIVIGTHALIQEGVDFARLGLIVIDEQHRFGVAQRLALREKGFGDRDSVYPDVLIMTATPIPRTLSLTVYGDLDISIIDEMPPQRKAIKTILKYESQRSSVYRFLKDEIARGRQAYVVYPLIEESEKLDLKAATESHKHLQGEIFPELTVGLIHGRLPSDEKDSIMGRFKAGEINILVSTTVIEVGIDVPNASVMVIEHAERFGLSQLHQLRGRVGRGVEQSYCVLVAPNWIAGARRREFQGEDEQLKVVKRLETMLQTNDGFRIAEVDLELRGPGDFFGTRQSGLPEFRIANLLTDGKILNDARREAFRLIDDDPHLRSPRHAAFRRHLFQTYGNHLNLLEVG
jgi:ATP-dependent DNA helicase RecG